MHATPQQHSSSGRDPIRKIGSSTPLLSTSFPDDSKKDQRAFRSQVLPPAGVAPERRTATPSTPPARFRDFQRSYVAGRVADHVAAVVARPEVALTLSALAAVVACALSGVLWMPEGGL